MSDGPLVAQIGAELGALRRDVDALRRDVAAIIRLFGLEHEQLPYERREPNRGWEHVDG